jgi:hypothetical protein
LDGLPAFEFRLSLIRPKFAHIIGLLNFLCAVVALSRSFALLAAARLRWGARVRRSANLRYDRFVPDPKPQKNLEKS